MGFLGVFLNFQNYFWNLLKKLDRVYFFSFWSYEPAFRQEGGEGEAVTNERTDGWMDGRTDERTNGKSTPRLRPTPLG